MYCGFLSGHESNALFVFVCFCLKEIAINSLIVDEDGDYFVITNIIGDLLVLKWKRDRTKAYEAKSVDIEALSKDGNILNCMRDDCKIELSLNDVESIAVDGSLDVETRNMSCRILALDIVNQRLNNTLNVCCFFYSNYVCCYVFVFRFWL